MDFLGFLLGGVLSLAYLAQSNFDFFGTAADYKSCCFYFSVVMMRP
jgi:hypothetical protein